MLGARSSRVLTLGCAAALGIALMVDGGGRPEQSNAVAHAQHHHLLSPVAAVAPARLSRTGWTVTVDSQEKQYPGTNAIDGSVSTYWLTRTSRKIDPLPHTFTIDMHASNTVSGLQYLPRQDGSRNGTIGQYRLEISANGTSWGTPVATGTWADDATEKTASFAVVPARYVRLTALTEAGNRGPWTSSAEINLLGAENPRLPRVGWTVAADSQETVGGNGAAVNAVDGSATTIWHTKWYGGSDPLPHTFTIDMHATNTVAGLQYLPRQDGSGNGRVGQYRVEVSADGAAWGTPVGTGTWADNATEKTAAFAAVPARYVRLTALTEAGNRGPWTSAAEINLLGTASTPPPTAGRWSGSMSFPLVPVAGALLPNNKLLTWSASATNNFGGSSGLTQTATWDLGTGVISQRAVSNTGHDMFCPGTAMLSDGRVMVNGGSNSDKQSIYDPGSDSWSAAAPLAIPRGYQSAVTLPDGRVFTIGGSWSGPLGGKDGEVWSAATGSRLLPGAPVAPMLTADPQGVYRSDNHGWLFTWTGDRVFQAGPSKAMNWYGTAGDGSQAPAGLRSDDTDAMNGNAVMYEPGKILTVGGATAYQNANATTGAYVIDISGSPVITRKVARMANARAFHNSVVLPDGKVLVVGGQSYPVPFSDDTSILTPELWDPTTETFTAMAPMSTPRTYHSISLLLPDARVISAGGGLCGSCSTNHPDAQIFTPPYLLNPDGSARPRPAIVSAPVAAAAGTSIDVSTDRAVTDFSLVRMGSTTHTVNTDQRRIPLTGTATSGSTSTLSLPADRGVLVPGYYMLFALDAAGVPSVARTIRVS
jgi:galactose oxidase